MTTDAKLLKARAEAKRHQALSKALDDYSDRFEPRQQFKPGLYTYKTHLQCAEIRKIKGKLYLEYICWCTGNFCSHEIFKGYNMSFLEYIGKVQS